MAKKAKKKTIKKQAAKAATRKKVVATKSYHLRENVTEAELVSPLAEDLRDAWFKLRAYAEELGTPRIYASHNSIMFSRKICFTFARPRKSFIEVWIFLPRALEGLKSVSGSKTKKKYANMFKLIHPDQVDEPLTDWIREAYEFAPAD